jgi:uncharacterized protein (TIGR02145 family)
MKKHLLNLLSFLLVGNLIFAQAPNKMSYQAIVRNSNNVVVTNHAVGMRISILQGSATGSSVYTETQIPTTNDNGLIAIEIGAGTLVSGNFSNIDWANGPYFVKTETDPNGGTNYSINGTSQLLSVPYAFYAKKAENGLPTGAQQGQTLTMCDGQLIWTNGGVCPAKITTFNINDTTHIGILISNSNASNISSVISYSGGNGGVYSTQNIQSTGVLGLTATLSSGTLNIGYGKLTLAITGTPSGSGQAKFSIAIGNQICIIYRTVYAQASLPVNSVYCNGTPTSIVNVVNPLTGKTWMDRNLGASQNATNTNDELAFGDLYQWGRAADGHQCRTSPTTSTLSTTDGVGHNYFIIVPNNIFDWRYTQNNNLWQGINGINNPCPSGYRIPSSAELESEKSSWVSKDKTGAFGSPLKLVLGGYRSYFNGTIENTNQSGYYWSNNVNGTFASFLYFSQSNAYQFSNGRSSGFSVRCIKE